MTSNEFNRRRNQAIENMLQMNARSTARQAEQPKFEGTKKPPNPAPAKTSGQGIDIPFLNFLSADKDTTLIIGLLLILMSENCDKMLLFALVYILM